MKMKFKIFIKCSILLLCLSTIGLNAQMLKDTASLNLLRKGIDYVYNFQFSDANDVYRKISHSYPENQIVYLFKGMITYWENYPLVLTSSARASYENDIRKCIELCEKKNDAANEAEILLSDLCARGLLLLFYADNDLSMDVFPLATSTYPYIRRSFNFTSVYSDFFFFTGLYNYYRDAYPEAHPIYKALTFLFPKGEKAKGLKELQIAAKNSILLKAEASSFLSGICLSFENNYKQASYYSKSLHELYPSNLEYTGEYVKNLLLIKQYDEAERLIMSPVTNSGNKYFQAQISIFNGILQEKKYHNYKLAEEEYVNGARNISLFGDYGNEFAAYAYFGLSRISDVNGDKQHKKTYRKIALKLAEYKKIDFD